MCNAYRHPMGCQCGFGPPYPDVDARIIKLVKWKDRKSGQAKKNGFPKTSSPET